MRSVDNKNFNFDVIVKTLALTDDVKLSAKDVNVKLDVEVPLFQPTSSQTDLPKLDSGKVGHQLVDQQVSASERKKGFKMTIYKRDGDNARGDIVGECFCNWNAGDEENWSPDQPMEHTCNVYKFDQHVGVITVHLIYVKKCDDGKSANLQKRRISLVGEDGKLSVFHEIKDQLNPRDIFFVVGDKSCAEAGGGNPLISCRGGNACKTELDPTRYKSVQGKLVKDFSVVPSCDHPECCGNMKDILDKFEDMFKIPIKSTGPEEDSEQCSTQSSCLTYKSSDTTSESKLSIKVIKPRTYTDPPKRCCSWANSPCGILFGPLTKRAVANPKTRKASTSTSVHMPHCPKKPQKRMLPKRKSCKGYEVTNVSSETESDMTSSCSCELCHGSCDRACDDSCHDSCKKPRKDSCESSTESEESLERVNVNRLVDKVLKLAKKCKEKEDIPQTCSAPDLVKSQFQLAPQNCPICCEDISWVQPNAPCPKCGFKLKIGLPVESAAYDETQTAEKILEKWNAEVGKFKRKKDINALGICLCNKSKECINCQLRRTSQKPIHEITAKVNRMGVQKEIDKLKQQEKAQKEVCQKNMVTNIVEEVLRQPPARATMEVANLLVKQDSEPNFTKALNWAKDQWAKNKNLLDSTSNLSNDSRTNILRRLHNAATPEAPEYKHRGNDSNLRKFKKKYVQQCRMRTKYPPQAYGHHYCKPKGKLVPKNMGWNWSLNISKDRFGWRPGAIRHKTRKIMDYFKKRKATAEAAALQKQLEEAAKALEKPKGPERPRLHVKKQRGQYTVTVHPLHDPNIPECERPERMKPIQLTIDKAASNDKRRQIKECLRHLEEYQDDIGLECCTEDPEIATAINNLKDLLGYENLRNILESESESQGSIDIELGGGVAPKLPTKANVEAQVEEDFNDPVRIPKKSGMYFTNPYNGKCYGPLDEKLSDSLLKPKPVIQRAPRIRFPPVFPPKKREVGDTSGEDRGKIIKTKKRITREPDELLDRRKKRQDQAGAGTQPYHLYSSLGKPGAEKKQRTDKKEKIPLKPEILPTQSEKIVEKDGKLEIRSKTLKKERKQDVKRVDEKPGKPTPNFEKPIKPVGPKNAGSSSSTKKKPKPKTEPLLDIEKNAAAEKPPARRLYTGPKKQPDRFIYDASKFERRKNLSCDIFEPCNSSPLTNLRFKADESNDEFPIFQEMLMCASELCPRHVVCSTPAMRLKVCDE